MLLRANDQVHISSVQSDPIRPGQEFEVSDPVGVELMKRHPALFEPVDAAAKKAAPKPKSKAAPPRKSKVEPAVSDKTAP